MFKIVTLLVIFDVQQMLAETYAPLDNCVHYTGPNYPYEDFNKIETEDGVASFSFYVTSPKTPHIQINAEPKYIGDFYEIVFDNRSELRRRTSGKSFTILSSGSRSDLLSTFKPFGVRVETELEGSRRRVDVFINDEEKPFLSGFDPIPLQPNYYSFASYQQTSQYWHKCTEPEPEDCSEYIGLIAALRGEIARITGLLSNILNKAGLTLNQITNILGGVVKGGNIIDALGNTVTSIGSLVGGVVKDAGNYVGGLLGGGRIL